MSANDISIEIDFDQASRAFERLERNVDPSTRRMVSQLSVLAESFMKENAPEGAGTNTHLRESVNTETDRQGKRARTYPTKRTDEGWLLVRAIVGNPKTPTYDQSVPVWSDGDGNAQGPLARWAAAKLGNANAAWPIANSWKGGGGQLSFPNPFVRDAFRQFAPEAEELAAEAFFGSMGVD